MSSLLSGSTRLRLTAAVCLAGVLGSLCWVPWALVVRTGAADGSAVGVGPAVVALGLSCVLAGVAGAAVGGGLRGVGRGALAGGLALSLAWILLGLPATLIEAARPAWEAVASGNSGEELLQRTLIRTLDRTTLVGFWGSWAIGLLGAVAGAVGAALRRSDPEPPWTAPDLAWPVLTHLATTAIGTVIRVALPTLGQSSSGAAERLGLERVGPPLEITATLSTGLASGGATALLFWAAVPLIRHRRGLPHWAALGTLLLCSMLLFVAVVPGTLILQGGAGLENPGYPVVLLAPCVGALVGALVGWRRPAPRTPTWGDALSDAGLTTLWASVVNLGIGGTWLGVALGWAVVPLINPLRNGQPVSVLPLVDQVLAAVPRVALGGLALGVVALVFTGIQVFALRWSDGALERPDLDEATAPR